MIILDAVSIITGAGHKRELRMQEGAVLFETRDNEIVQVTELRESEGGYVLRLKQWVSSAPTLRVKPPRPIWEEATRTLYIRSGAEGVQLFLNCVKRPRRVATFYSHAEYRQARKRHPLGKHFMLRLDGWRTPRVAAYLYPERVEDCE